MIKKPVSYDYKRWFVTINDKIKVYYDYKGCSVLYALKNSL